MKIAGSPPNKPAEAGETVIEIPDASRDEDDRVKQRRRRRIIRVLLASVLLIMLGLVVSVFIFALIIEQRTVTGRELIKLVESGDFQEIDHFIAKHPISVNGEDDFGCTPLRYAVLNKRTDVVKMLLKNGAKASIPD